MCINTLKEILGCNEEYYEKLYLEVGALLAEAQQQLYECQEKLKPWDEGTKPTWLIDSVPYRPTIEVEGEKVYLNPTDIYMECPTLRDKATKWRELTLDEKLWEIWKFVIVQVNYKYDADENWQIPIVTLVRGRGDCEDSTNLFVTLCRIAHVPADRVFNACGWYKTESQGFGHSFPIVKMSDDKWYVMESTLSSIPSSPKIFKSSNYDMTWGVANWKFAGKGPDQI